MKILIQLSCNRVLSWITRNFELMYTQGAGKKEGRALPDNTNLLPPLLEPPAAS
jgi:hypothetical protein